MVLRRRMDFLKGDITAFTEKHIPNIKEINAHGEETASGNKVFMTDIPGIHSAFTDS